MWLANLSAVSFHDISIGKYCLPAALTAQGPSRQASAASSSLVGCWLMRKLPQRPLAISFQRRLDWVPEDTCGVGACARTLGFDARRMEEGKLEYGGVRDWNAGPDRENLREHKERFSS